MFLAFQSYVSCIPGYSLYYVCHVNGNEHPMKIINFFPLPRFFRCILPIHFISIGFTIQKTHPFVTPEKNTQKFVMSSYVYSFAGLVTISQ